MNVNPAGGPSAVLLFADWFEMNQDAALQLVCALGCCLALIGIFISQSAFIFASLWFLSLSMLNAGSTFSSFQWDILLVETGFIAILLAPFPLLRHSTSPVAQFLMRWLLFRLMFSSGLVKLLSRGVEWWSLTALERHYETTCLIHIGTWLAYHVSLKAYALECNCLMFLCSCLR